MHSDFINCRVTSSDALIQKKLRKVYPVWCSLLPQQTPTKKLRKKLGGPSKFFRGPDPRISPVVAPMLLMLPQRCDQLLEIERCY